MLDMFLMSSKGHDIQRMKRLETLFLTIKLNWIRLDGLLRCVKYLPCQHNLPTAAEEMAYFEDCEKAWKKVHFLGQTLIKARISAGLATPSDYGQFMWSIARLKTPR